MKLKPETLYSLRENIRLIGPKRMVKWLFSLSFIAWIFWPESNPAPLPHSPSSAQQATSSATPDPTPPASHPTDKDLRSIMTAEQSAFYWDSFQWMMQHGPELKPKSIDGKIIFIRYLKDASFTASNGLICRPYSEKLIIRGRSNTRQGIACQIQPGNWCRQAKQEKAQCRIKGPTGLAALSSESAITLHNFKTGWDANLYKWGF